MRPLSRPIRILLFSLGGIALCTLIVTAVAWNVLRTVVSPAQYVPTQATVALFHGLTKESAETMETHFPILKDIKPLPEGSDVDIAIVRLQDGSFGWVKFISGETFKAMNSRMPLDTDAFAIRPSSDEVAKMLLPQTDALATNTTYRTLTEAATPHTPWLFIDARNLLTPTASPVDQYLVSQLGEQPFVLLQETPTSMALSFLPTKPLLRRSAPSAPMLSSPAPSFSVTTASLGAFHDATVTSLPHPQQTVLEGMAQQALLETVGNDVSLRYDLLPLLQRAGTFAIGSASGSTRFLLTGTAEENKTLQSVIDSLHAGMDARLSTGTVRHLSFPHGGFSTSTITNDSGMVERKQGTASGWQLRTTALQDGSQGLYTAIAQNRFIITTDAHWLQQSMHETPTSFRDEQGIRLASGSISETLLNGAMSEDLHLLLPSTLLDAFGPHSPILAWSLLSHGNALSLLLTSER